MSLGLSEVVQTDFRVATDQIYPWVHYNNSFSSRKMSYSVEMCRMTLVVLCFTHGPILPMVVHILITLLCPWNSVEMFSMTLVVRWTNSTQNKCPWVGTLPSEKCPWDVVCRLTFALLRIKYTDGFFLILILLVQE